MVRMGGRARGCLARYPVYEELQGSGLRRSEFERLEWALLRNPLEGQQRQRIGGDGIVSPHRVRFSRPRSVRRRGASYQRRESLTPAPQEAIPDSVRGPFYADQLSQHTLLQGFRPLLRVGIFARLRDLY